MLGFDGALDAPRSAKFGQGSGRVLLSYVGCDGTEDNLADCAHAGIERYLCRQTRDAGAICYSGIHPKPFQVRLVGGSNDAEGRVELNHNGSWGTICDYLWDLRDARVVCRMAGFDGALDAPGSARFGQGSGRILLKYVTCDGNEENLVDCAHAGIERYSCSHTRDSGVICYSGIHPKPFQVRLVGGSNDAEGRVELKHNGSWGTICDDLWDLRDARVVCKMGGFDGALDAPRSARFGQGSGRSLLKYVNCDGTEDNLADCAHAGIGRYICSHTRDAGAVCYSGAAPGSARFGAGSGEILFDDVGCKGTEDALAECYHRGLGINNCEHDRDAGVICFTGAPFLVKLVNGSTDLEGRVEVLYDGFWGTVCDHEWDLRDARVVCKMLGFDGALTAPGSAAFGQDPFKVRLTDGANDSEGRVEVMYNGSWGTVCDNGWDTNDARVVCRMLGFDGALAATVSARFVRLIGGTNDAEGRVEILHDGSWGTVCDDSWDLKDAEVVCKMLSFEGALDAPLGARFGKGSGSIFLDEVQCHGTETDIERCDHDGIGINNCAHNEDASVICIQKDPFQVRLVGGSNDAKGRVEVMYDGSWGTICDGDWDLRDARVVCRMLGFDGALDAPRSARFGQGSGRILLNWVACDGTEDQLADCGHQGIGDFSSCGHARDAGAICYSGDPFQVRLGDGSNDAKGRVEVLYDGSWGTICDGGWDLRDARVVCRMLGYDGVLDAPISARFGQGSGRILLANVNCKGIEDNLADCAHAGIGDYTSCGHAKDAGVICYSGVRLVGGSNDAEGRVEVLHEGSWGTICDDWWDLRDARVVCRMLGFDGTLEAKGSARFGQGSGDILLDDVGCDGTEDNLADCAHLGIRVHNCGHGEDAGTICYSGKRLSAVVSSRKQKSQVALTVNKNTTGEQVHIRGDSGQNATHEYMDMNTIRERLPSSKDEDIDGYLLPTATTPEPRVYMEIGTTTADEARVQTNAKMAVTGVSLGDDKVKVARSSPDMQYDIIPDYTNITTA
eukprot:XP_011666465.1 PREDICTED: deleted in malignant brain tumors 1 protein-like [Strongylocentrotus purpuratus]